MDLSNVVCFVLHGLLVTAFPTGDNEYEGVDFGLLGVPVKGNAEFSGTAIASGYCSIVGQSPCPDLLPVTSPIVTPANIVLESDDAVAYDTEHDENMAPTNTEYYEAASGKIPNKVILGALIADAITKERGAEVDSTLAELDAFIEAEIGSLGPLIQNALSNADMSEVDRGVDSALLEIESKIASEFAMVDAFIDSELIRTEEFSLFTIAQCLNETTEIENANMTEKEALIAMELATLESFVESQLAKAEAIIDAELEKVNSFVESELAKVDGIVESELAKVDLFVETELAKTDANVKSELSKVESFVENELAKVEPVEGTVDFNDGSAINDESSSCSISSKPYVNLDDVTQDGIVYVSGTFPVSGRTLILGNTGCPPIIPTAEPLPLHVESFPVFETIHYDDSYGEEFTEVLYDDVTEIPIAGEAVFSGVAPAEGSCKIFGGDSLPINRDNASPPMVGEATPFITQQVTESCNDGYLPLSGYIQKTEPAVVKPQLKILPTVNVEGNVNFSGTARATGSTTLYAHFPCAPLTATEIGPGGKKYIWISKKTPKSVPSPQSAERSRSRPEFPTYSEDFPETIIMDSTKNYEKLMSEDLNVDFGVLGPMTVAGDVFFEGTAPAFGSVSIRGHCA